MIKSTTWRLLLFAILFVTCKEKKEQVPQPFPEEKTEPTKIKYANGFTIETGSSYSVLKVKSPWPGSEKEFKYALIPREKLPMITLPKGAYDAIIATPVENLVVTSTTHIPALESLNGLEKLVGFPDTKYVSSKAARHLISEGKIRELGSNESLNTEVVINLQPDVVVGFSIDNQNAAYETISKARIPVVYNGDWTEQSPIGKAEWIKFFGALLEKEKEADRIFNEIEESYQKIKNLASEISERPTVLSGALYKDVWYLPAGESWASQFLADANTDYLWASTEGSGSLSLSLESVLEQGRTADFWISPSQFTSYSEMQEASSHYTEFDAFQNQKVYTFAATKGETGGLLYYELAPQRPDLVLKDLVHIFHPEVLPEHEPYFFTPLQK
ncbi:ABC transporter substrate-binding protein [Allomuricauda sp. d1]|uniref:ABC transporter substrate-binding protein n=1 Tax=Allomuricauda sp. d1 TaxID=3136725 RepID=UPI0031DD6B16